MYFDSFEVEHILNEIEIIVGNKNIKTNINRIEAFDSIIFSPNEYGKNDKIILKHFQ